MNKSFLVGRITKDLELRTTTSGVTTVSFTVAINRAFTTQSGEREADFINVVAWRKQAENVSKYCSKGSLVGIDGRIQTRNYDDKEGKKVYVTEVVADNITFLGSKSDRQENNYRGESTSNYNDNQTSPIENNGSDVSEDPFKDFGSEVSLSDDDLPF